MLIELKQNTFRFMILSHINELLINKGLVVNSIKRAIQPYNTPRSLKEIDSGLQPALDPYFTKKIDQILRDLQAFAVSDEDTARMGASDSTLETEVKSAIPVAKITTQKFMLKSAWGYINKDEIGQDLTADLETSFNDYLNICRNIATWAILLYEKKNLTTVLLGASSLSLLTTKWGPVDLSDDLSDFYNKLFDHIYYYALEGKVAALLDSSPVGIAIHQVTKPKMKFDEYGYLDIKAPLSKQSTYPNSKFYITDVDLVIVEDACGTPDITLDTELSNCSDSVTIRLKEYEGMPICTQNKPLPPFYPTPIIDPPIVYPPITPPDPPKLPTLFGCIAVAFYFDCSGTSRAVGDPSGIEDNYTYWGCASGLNTLISKVFTECDAFSLTIRANHALTTKPMSTDKSIPGQGLGVCNHWCGFDVYVGLELAINEALSVNAQDFGGGRHVVVVTQGLTGWNISEPWGWDTSYQTVQKSSQARIDYRNDLIKRIRDNNIKLHIISPTVNKGLIALVNSDFTDLGLGGRYLSTLPDTKGGFFQVNTFNSAFDAISVKVPDRINRTIGKPSQPIASFTFEEGEGDAPLHINFTNSDQENTTYSWSFGDGSFSTEINPTHLYAANGQYTVILKAMVTDDEGKTYSDSYQETVCIGAIYALPLVASFELTNPSGWVPFEVDFTNRSTGLYSSLYWDFGDGEGSTDSSPTHIYQKAGIFYPALTITKESSGETNTYTYSSGITTAECFELRVAVDVIITVLEKFNFSYDMLIGVTLQKLLFDFESFKDNCSIDIVSDAKQLPKDLKPIAVVDLKYAEIEGEGKYNSPVKIGEDVKWNETGLLRYEVISANPYSIKLTFNARTAFPSPVNPNLVIFKNLPPYTFTKDTNILGLSAPDGSILLIKFDVYNKTELITTNYSVKDWEGTTSYTTLEICALLNEAFDVSQLIAYPDQYNKPVIASLNSNPVRIISNSEGSTANEVFGFNTSGDLGIPIIGAGNIDYKVALYVACIVNEGSSPYTEYAISKLIGKHRVITNDFKIISPNYFEALYGKYPKIISNRLFLPPGHRYIHHSEITLKRIEETTQIPAESRELTSGYFNNALCYDNATPVDTAQWNVNIAKKFNLFSPYWEGMICDSSAYPANVDLWLEGDDKRFYVSRALDTKNNCLEIVGHYDFMAPVPMIRNQVTARKKGPYTLPLDPGRSRTISLRQMAVSNYYVSATVDEGDSTSPSLDYVGYTAATQVLLINVNYLENPYNPKFTPRVLTTPYVTWEDGTPVNLTGIWEGVGSSYLTCVIDPTGHSRDTLTIGFWIDYGNPETMQLDEWSYIELPFGTGTVEEMIKAMQRNGDWLRTNKSKMYWTQSTTYLNPSGYVIFKDKGDLQSTYQFIDADGYLRIKTSIDFDLRIRIGGSPENCFANSVFGWNPLGELGDRVNATKGPYYTYTYSLDTYVTKDPHPSVGSIQPTYHESQLVKYKEVYNNVKQSFYDEDGNVVRDLYKWEICGFGLVKMSTISNIYLDLLEKMFSVICPLRKGGNLPPSDIYSPITVNGGNLITITTENKVESSTCNKYEDFLFLLKTDEVVSNIIGIDLVNSLERFMTTGEYSEEDELKYDLPWYDCKKVFNTIATQVKSLLCSGGTSAPSCKQCDNVVTSTVINPELLDLSCDTIDDTTSTTGNSIIEIPLDCGKFYNVYPYLLEPIKKKYIPISLVEYYPCSCTERQIPKIVITYNYSGKNTLYTTINPVDNETIYLESDFTVDMHQDTLLAPIPIESNMAILGVYINDENSLESVKKISIDYSNSLATFEMCGIVSNQWSIRSGLLNECYPLSGLINRQYTFESTLHGTVEVTIPKSKTQITPEGFVELLSVALSPFQVSIISNRITINPGNYSLQLLTAPVPDPFNIENVLLYENTPEVVKVGTTLKVGDLIVGESVLDIKITLFYAYVINSDTDVASAFISG